MRFWKPSKTAFFKAFRGGGVYRPSPAFTRW